MGIEIIRTEDGKIGDVLFNGKPVKRGSMRGLRKAQNTPYWFEYKESAYGVNPYTGVAVELEPLEVSIYDWCSMWYKRYELGSNTLAPIETYDDMKYFLLELNHSAYMDLID